VTHRHAEAAVLGDALLDVSVAPSAPIRSGADVPAAVQALPGGQGANLAIRLSRRGRSVHLVCGLADDSVGRLVADALRAETVHVAAIEVPSTGTVVVLRDAFGERTMMSQRSPFAASLGRDAVPAAPWTLVSGYLFLEPAAPDLGRLIGALDTRRVVVGCAVPPPMRPAWLDAVREARADLLILNREEAAQLGSIDDLATVVVTTSATEVRAAMGAASATLALPDARPAVDTTGAGDAFAAALVDGLMDGTWPPSAEHRHSSVLEAARVAGEVALVVGAQARVPSERLREAMR